MSEVADAPETKVTGTSGLGDGRTKSGDRLGHLPDDLVGGHDAEVVVGHEGEQPPPD